MSLALFIVETNDNSITGLQLYPTVIGNFQARRADGGEAREIVLKMAKLCAEFSTLAIWDKQDHCLKIKIC